jgi:hypothetical protein
VKLPFKLTEAKIRIFAIVGVMALAWVVLVISFYLTK